MALPVVALAIGCAGGIDAPGAPTADQHARVRAPAPIEQRDIPAPRAGAPSPSTTVAARGTGRAPRAAAPVDQRVMATRPPAPETPPPAPAAPRPHPAQPAPDWAAGPGTPLSAYALRPDDAQPFDPLAAPRTHTVAAGETLYALSARYQTPLRALVDANRLEAPFALSTGQTLRIPPPRTVTVQRGETLDAIATRYAIDARSLAYLNRLAAPFEVRAGDRLVIPGLARPPQRARDADLPPQEPQAPPLGKKKGAIKFAWPLRGKVVARFGPQPNGLRSDGIDIEAKPGAPVRAAAAGDVVYAGDDLPGYGALVLVKHPDGWVTAYARTQRIVAKEGAKVRQGDVIAESGARLHFQVRRGAEPADPLSALPPV
ncbi:MAG: M23 family metallopeptidase [Alphaproteobacteria bacterium]|nr:M23 family metallopeptidase [Alphaproteobacteria bacterium]